MINWLEKRRIVSLIFTILIAIEIFIFSSIPGSSVSSGGNIWLPRLYHMTVFFLFNFFLLILIKGNKKMTFKTLITSWIISLVYAASDEIHQIFVPFRSAGIEDFLTDSIGIFLSGIIFLWLYKKE